MSDNEHTFTMDGVVIPYVTHAELQFHLPSSVQETSKKPSLIDSIKGFFHKLLEDTPVKSIRRPDIVFIEDDDDDDYTFVVALKN